MLELRNSMNHLQFPNFVFLVLTLPRMSLYVQRETHCIKMCNASSICLLVHMKIQLESKVMVVFGYCIEVYFHTDFVSYVTCSIMSCFL